MDIFELIKTRRSVFPPQYNAQPIDQKTIQKVLETANWAPTHAKTEPWRFKVIQGAKKTELGIWLSAKYQETAQKPQQIKAKNFLENPSKAAVIIAIIMKRDEKERIPEWEEIAAVSMAVQNMWLACTALKIGAYWSSPSMIKYADEFFSMASDEKCLGFFYMGYYDTELAEGVRQPMQDKIEWLG